MEIERKIPVTFDEPQNLIFIVMIFNICLLLVTVMHLVQTYNVGYFAAG